MTGRGESLIDALLQPLYAEWAAWPIPVRATILAAMGQIELHVSAVDAVPAEAERVVDAAVEIKRLKRENAELRRANEILKAASAFFAAELDRPTTR